jgi:hypothetical protein
VFGHEILFFELHGQNDVPGRWQREHQMRQNHAAATVEWPSTNRQVGRRAVPQCSIPSPISTHSWRTITALLTVCLPIAKASPAGENSILSPP